MKTTRTAKIIGSLIAGALVSLALGAQQEPRTEQPAAKWTGAAELGYAGKHVFRGVQQSRQALQAGVEYKPAGNGLYAGGWYNQPFHDDYNNELDLYGGYRHELHGVRLDGGIIAYLYPEADTGLGETGSSCELALRASYEVLPKQAPGWTISGAAFHDMRLETRTLEVSTGYSLPFKLDHYEASADFRAYAGHSHSDNLLPDLDAPNVKDDWAYLGASAGVTVRFSKLLSATASLQYGRAHGRGAARAATDKLWGLIGAGLSW
jgi:uncharacterized protein (TIGR02001 family)